MNGKINRENFSLSKLKLSKGGGVESTVKIELSVDGSFMEIERSQKTPVIPSPDLENPIRTLKEKLLRSCGYMDMNTIINSPEFKATKAQKEAAEKALDILMNKTNVTGVHKSGQDQNEGVIITGKIKAENGANIAINSPRMRYTSEVYGFEEELQDEVEQIEGELYLYLQEGKKGQLEAFTGEEQGGKPESDPVEALKNAESPEPSGEDE